MLAPLPFRRQEDIARFDVAVDQTCGMCGIKGVGNG